MLVWVYYGLFLGCTLFVFFIVFRIGKYRGRKEVIHVFDEILVRVHQLVLSGRNKELHLFLDDICSKTMRNSLKASQEASLDRNNSETEGYTQ